MTKLVPPIALACILRSRQVDASLLPKVYTQMALGQFAVGQFAVGTVRRKK